MPYAIMAKGSHCVMPYLLCKKRPDTTLFFTNCFGQYEKKEAIYSRNYMLDFPLFMAVPSAYYYLSVNNIHKIFYDSSSCVIYKTNWLVWK